MEEKKNELILGALEIYMKLGIKSITMDEMARQLGVSKKTLYLYVKDKNQLVEECVKMAQYGESCAIKDISESNNNAIDEIIEVSKFVIEQLKKVHPSIFFDLQKYHPNVMKMMDCHKDEFVRGCVVQNLERGIEQGYYRDNLNVEVISKLYLAMIDHVMVGNIVEEQNTTMDQIYSEFFRYHIRGIASKKGLEYLIELKKNNESL